MVKVLISSDAKFPVDRKKIRVTVAAVILEKGVSSDVEVSVLICGTRKARELAKKYLQDDCPHNVLSFPQESFPVLGDIVVCYPLAQQQAIEENKLTDSVVCELVGHGVLHLLGEHHVL